MLVHLMPMHMSTERNVRRMLLVGGGGGVELGGGGAVELELEEEWS